MRKTVSVFFPQLIVTDEEAESVDFDMERALEQAVKELKGEKAVAQQEPHEGGTKEFFAKCVEHYPR
jgi:ABC-type Mn2+/Zn2+ transport system ATPase subunit